MQKNALYLQLKQIATENNYTIEHIQSLTADRIKELLELGGVYDGFVANLKDALLKEWQNKYDQTFLQNLKSQLIDGSRVWLQNNFPKAEFEMGAQNGKRFVRIWLNGRPSTFVANHGGADEVNNG